uniref:Uncharacterized protein n=1 Tax=Rhodnius prolixus TaxID=13249 RepID=T1I0E1_RHOPR
MSTIIVHIFAGFTLIRIYSNWAQPTDRQAKTLDFHALLVAALTVAKSRSRQVSPQKIVHLG